ncbi:MAG: hypothetical protein ACF8CQ_14490 [Rhodopirellula sp. JB044]|uniref:hypothetical protein n=1 Tax=Rhodopirellula sp. JB044 TaxID=3342844 RepID=UPI00370A7788
MNANQTTTVLLVPFLLATTALGKDVDKPTGTYASVITPRAVQNKHMQGGLVRVTWSEIEPAPGKFDFSRIDQQVQLLKPGMNWTLAVHGGWTSPEATSRDQSRMNTRTVPNGRFPGNRRTPAGFQRAELQRSGNNQRRRAPSRGPQRPRSLAPDRPATDTHVETFEMSFRGTPVDMPKYWDRTVQKRLKTVLSAVGQKYSNDERLKLVYVPQMTSNGTEGHFNGVPDETLLQAAGINPRARNASAQFGKLWVNAATEVTQSVMDAFPNKAIAFELHELFRSVDIPALIINEFQKSIYEDRVGVAIWWISGKTSYQSNLLAVLEKYDGDLYGQVIGRSDQAQRFGNGDYATVFQQATQLGMRYIEPWNYEFENHTHDELFEGFNRSAQAKFTR